MLCSSVLTSMTWVEKEDMDEASESSKNFAKHENCRGLQKHSKIFNLSFKLRNNNYKKSFFQKRLCL